MKTLSKNLVSYLRNTTTYMSIPLKVELLKNVKLNCEIIYKIFTIRRIKECLPKLEIKLYEDSTQVYRLLD